MSLIIIGEYLGRRLRKKKFIYELFHFKGSYNGHLIKGVYIRGLDRQLIRKTEYLVYLDHVNVFESYIYGHMVKIKPIKNILT